MTDTQDLSTQWLPHIEAWEKSGQSQAAYCRENGLVHTRFTYWKLKLRPTAPSHEADPAPGFVPVRVLGQAPAGLTLRLPNGVTVEGISDDNLSLAQRLAGTWL